MDNTGFGLKGNNTDLFGFSAENTERIKKQNSESISVIIGNPPYNAKQENYNQQNANRSYKEIDNRIKATYIKECTAQNQIVVYDMYVRFYRWATERLDKERGVLHSLPIIPSSIAVHLIDSGSASEKNLILLILLIHAVM